MKIRLGDRLKRRLKKWLQICIHLFFLAHNLSNSILGATTRSYLASFDYGNFFPQSQYGSYFHSKYYNKDHWYKWMLKRKSLINVLWLWRRWRSYSKLYNLRMYPEELFQQCSVAWKGPLHRNLKGDFCICKTLIERLPQFHFNSQFQQRK